MNLPTFISSVWTTGKACLNFELMIKSRDYTFRQPKIEDAKEICDVFIESVSTLCRPEYNSEEIEYWNSNKTPKRVQEWIENENFYFLVAEDLERICGVGFIDYTTGELYACYLRPEAKGFGVGRKLMSLMILEAKQRRLKKVFLKASLNAKKFYEQQGFTVVTSHLDLKPPEGIPNYKMELSLQ